MRTTVDLPEPLFRRLKANAALEGISLKKYIMRSLENELKRNEKPSGEKRIELPLVPSKKPGRIRLTGEKIALLLEEEDINASS